MLTNILESMLSSMQAGYSAGTTDRLPLTGTSRTMFWTYIALFSVPCIEGKRELLLMASYTMMPGIRHLCRDANTL